MLAALAALAVPALAADSSLRAKLASPTSTVQGSAQYTISPVSGPTLAVELTGVSGRAPVVFTIDGRYAGSANVDASGNVHYAASAPSPVKVHAGSLIKVTQPTPTPVASPPATPGPIASGVFSGPTPSP